MLRSGESLESLADDRWCLPSFLNLLFFFFFPGHPYTGQTGGHGSLHGEEAPSLHWRINWSVCMCARSVLNTDYFCDPA